MFLVFAMFHHFFQAMVVLPERDMNVAGHPERGPRRSAAYDPKGVPMRSSRISGQSAALRPKKHGIFVFSMFYPRLNIVKLC